MKPLSKHTDEASYLARWREATAEAQTPEDFALLGGAEADAFPWVFVAGYQAAIRATFDVNAISGWLAFAATEDRSGERPGVRYEDGALSGCKTWVAASDHIEAAVVSAGRGADTRYWLVPRGSMTLDRRPGSNRFLGAMSQGSLMLEHTTDAMELHPENIRSFARAEARFVHMAYCAHVRRSLPDLAAQAEATLADGVPGERMMALLEAHQALLPEAEELWLRDSRVVRMYVRTEGKG